MKNQLLMPPISTWKKYICINSQYFLCQSKLPSKLFEKTFKKFNGNENGKFCSIFVNFDKQSI